MYSCKLLGKVSRWEALLIHRSMNEGSSSFGNRALALCLREDNGGYCAPFGGRSLGEFL